MPIKDKPTLKDVAALAGVSNAAASYAVNGTPGLSAEVRERILKAAAEIGYQPNKIARMMKTGKTDTVGLVLPDLKNPYFVEIAGAIEKAARDAGKCVFLMNTDNREELVLDSIARLSQHRVDGIICCPLRQSGFSDAFSPDTPTVFINGVVNGFDSVMADYKNGGKQIAQLLQAKSRRKIGLINGLDGTLSAKRKRNGLVSALGENQEIAWEKNHSFAPPLDAELVSFVLDNPVDAIVAPNDLIAIELISLFHEQGVSVPGQTAIIGFNDIAFAEIVSPKLATVRQPIEDLGASAFEVLMWRISNRNADLRSVILDVEIIARESAG